MTGSDTKPVDILSARIAQAKGVLTAITLTYDADAKQYSLTAAAMNSALWGLEELLDQLEAAFERLVVEGQL